MGKYSRDELERAFIHYWRTGAAGEDWDAWADLFTEDCTYFEHWYGLMHGRETVRAWIVPIMDKYREIYTGYEWHVIDEDRGIRIAHDRFVLRTGPGEKTDSQLGGKAGQDFEDRVDATVRLRMHASKDRFRT